jgi:hypothetical protein
MGGLAGRLIKGGLRGGLRAAKIGELASPVGIAKTALTSKTVRNAASPITQLPMWGGIGLAAVAGAWGAGAIMSRGKNGQPETEMLGATGIGLAVLAYDAQRRSNVMTTVARDAAAADGSAAVETAAGGVGSLISKGREFASSADTVLLAKGLHMRAIGLLGAAGVAVGLEARQMF